MTPDPTFVRIEGCDLCRAARITPWYHEDEICWIAECEICAVPMVVSLRQGCAGGPGRSVRKAGRIPWGRQLRPAGAAQPDGLARARSAVSVAS